MDLLDEELIILYLINKRLKKNRKKRRCRTYTNLCINGKVACVSNLSTNSSIKTALVPNIYTRNEFFTVPEIRKSSRENPALVKNIHTSASNESVLPENFTNSSGESFLLSRSITTSNDKSVLSSGKFTNSDEVGMMLKEPTNAIEDTALAFENIANSCEDYDLSSKSLKSSNDDLVVSEKNTKLVGGASYKPSSRKKSALVPNNCPNSSKKIKKVRDISNWGFKENSDLFKNLYQDLRSSDDKFFDFLGMSIASFDELLGYLKDHIKRQNTVMRTSITPEERLVITLRYFSKGCTYTELHSTFGIGMSTGSSILREVTPCIWSILAKKEIPCLNHDKFLEISQGFLKTTNFPHCIGAIDGKRIQMVQSDRVNSATYDTYKDVDSIFLLAVCDSDFKFTFVEVGSYEKSSESEIFKNSTIREKLATGSLDIPPASPLEGEEGLFPYVIVGDKSFSVMENLMRPYGDKTPAEDRKSFDFRLSRARQCIDTTFEIFVNKWQIFQRPFHCNIHLVENIVKAVCVLHNFVLKRDGLRNVDKKVGEHALVDIEDDYRSRASNAVYSSRDRFAKFFLKNPLDEDI